MPLFGAAFAPPNKGTTFYTDEGKKKVSSSTENRIQGLFEA